MPPKKMFRASLTDAEEVEMLAMLRHLKLIVADFGDDYRYPLAQRPRSINSWTGDEGPGCWYVHEGEPDCLAGRVLNAMGVSVEALLANENRPCDLLEHVGPYFSRHTLFVLRMAQAAQDSGKTWGDARDAALEFAYTEYGVTAA